MLTPKQRELLTFIETYVVEHRGVSPSFDEMKTGVGLKAKSGIHRLLIGLEERGFVRRLRNRNRAIVVVPPAARPGAMHICPSCAGPVQPVFNFCPACGGELRPHDRAPAQPERRAA